MSSLRIVSTSLDLALVEEAKQVPMIADVINTVEDVSMSSFTFTWPQHGQVKEKFRDHVIGGRGSLLRRTANRNTTRSVMRRTVRCAAFRYERAR